MKCPICGNNVELRKKQVGTDKNGEPIFHRYAICKNCRKQWNLDKQQPKEPQAGQPAAHRVSSNTRSISKEEVKAAAAAQPDRTSASKNRQTTEGSSQKKRQTTAGNTHTNKRSTAGAGTRQARPADGRASAQQSSKRHSQAAPDNRPKSPSADQKTVKKRSPEDKKRSPEDKKRNPENKTASSKQPRKRKDPIQTEEQHYSNIPPENIRTKREHAVKKGYKDMLASDSGHSSGKKKRPAPEKTSANSRKVRPKKETEDYEDFEEDSEPAKFRAARIVLGVLSIVAFVYFTYRGFLAGLDNIASGSSSDTGTTYIVLALCMLVSGLLLLILQKRNTVFAFLLPMAFYAASSVYAFLKRSGDSQLLYGSIAGIVLALVFLVLTILLRRALDEEYDSSEEYEDPFEDDYE